MEPLAVLHTERRECRLCHRELPLILFYTFKRNGKRQGQVYRRKECCDCHKLQMAFWWSRNRRKILARRKRTGERRKGTLNP